MLTIFLFFPKTRLIKNYFHLYILILPTILNFRFSHCQSIPTGCVRNPSLNDELCFTNIIKLDNRNYQASNFAKNKNGDLAIEFSEHSEISSTRLLYGLTKDGRYLFKNESSYTHEINIVNTLLEDFSFDSIYKTTNLFVSIKDTSNKENQFFFSLNTYYSTVELHDLNNDDVNTNKHYIWKLNDFFNLNEEDYIFPYECNLLELPNENAYIIAFIPTINVYVDILDIGFIKKFTFRSFDNDPYEEKSSVKYNDYLNRRILKVILMDGFDTFAVFSFSGYAGSGYIHLKFYDNNLTPLNDVNDLTMEINLYNQLQDDIFFKVVYVEEKHIMLVYFSEYFLCFEMHKIDYNTGVTRITLLSYFLTGLDEFLNDFTKVNDNKLIFICTNITVEDFSLQSSNNFNIFIINIIKDNSNSLRFGIQQFILFSFGNYIPTWQIYGTYYNGYLLFSTIYKIKDDPIDNNYFSLFMILSYANGTDSTTDVSYFLKDNENYQNDKSFFDFLYQNLTIENNIFGYIAENVIKLNSIPNEIIIMDENDLLPLENNSLMNQSYNYILQQNRNITKTSQYYHIYYQYLIKDPQDSNSEITYYYSRMNQLKFKLCHDYCNTCQELGTSNNEQKCLSCLPSYQYDYWYYNNYTSTNCVPEGYFNDLETNTLLKCDQKDYKFYINITDNKTICFKDNYECPKSYPSFNSETKECFYCDYYRFKNGECSLNNSYTTAEDVYEAIKEVIILNYDNEGEYFKINTDNNFIYQIGTVNNELKYLKENKKSNYSVIDLNECADLLKKENGLDPNTDLIILKYENEEEIITNGNEKSIQYEVYVPNSTTKLDLSVCSDVKIDIYVPIQLSEETKKLYEELKSQGYNLFDKNDKFYKDICTPYKSENGTDVLLADRYNDFFVSNELICQSNCLYSDYLPDSQYLKCECNVVNEEKIEIKEPTKITAKSVVKSFYDILKYSNYKVLWCYKLVFRKVTFTENVGSILTYSYFIGYILAFMVFIYRKLYYLKEEIGKLLNKEKQDENKDKDTVKDIPVISLENYTINKVDIKGNDDNKQEEVKKITFKRSKSKKRKRKSQALSKNDNIIDINVIKKSRTIRPSDEDKIKNNIFENKDYKNSPNSKIPILDEKKEKKEKNENNLEIKTKEETKNEKEILSDYELNDLEYSAAIELDKRNFFGIYYYLLKREHIILFTFFNWKDFNIFSIKLSKFFLSISIDMAFNALFFSDESMHKIYVSGGEHDFIGQLAQMIYSTLTSQLLQIFINFLTMTDIQYYKIKELVKEKNINQKKFRSQMEFIKNKIITFYSFTFLLFLFFWYLISAFCAVYENTQRIFIIDSLTSFAMGLVYPFILYLFPAGLRVLSLRKKNLKYIYSLSDKIPFF